VTDCAPSSTLALPSGSDQEERAFGVAHHLLFSLGAARRTVVALAVRLGAITAITGDPETAALGAAVLWRTSSKHRALSINDSRFIEADGRTPPQPLIVPFGTRDLTTPKADKSQGCSYGDGGVAPRRCAA
jgi:hypothetical protein